MSQRQKTIRFHIGSIKKKIHHSDQQCMNRQSWLRKDKKKISSHAVPTIIATMVAWIVIVTFTLLLFDIWLPNYWFAMALSHYSFQCTRYAVVLYIVAAMFLRWPPNVVTVRVLRTWKRFLLSPWTQNLQFDTGIMAAGLLIAEIYKCICMAYMFFKMAAKYAI